MTISGRALSRVPLFVSAKSVLPNLTESQVGNTSQLERVTRFKIMCFTHIADRPINRTGIAPLETLTPIKLKIII